MFRLIYHKVEEQTSISSLSFANSEQLRCCSNEGLNVALASGLIVEGVSPVLGATEGLEE